MAYRPSPNSLIHCAECGEDYSATYKRCPFCGAKNAVSMMLDSRPSRTAPEAEPGPRSASGRRTVPADPDDTYVFSGQDLFDEPDEEDYAPARIKGGKRLAEKPSANPFANADINWPRVITFVCSLIIIVAAMVIVFTVVYPQLRGDPTIDTSQTPSFPASDPVGDNSQDVNPDGTDPMTDNTDPVTEPTDDMPPAGPDGLTAISFKGATDDDFTLQPEESHTITLSFTPADWSGTVTWTSSDPQYATVDANGKVTNVNTTDQLHSVTITATAEGISVRSKVFCRGVSATEPPAIEPPASNPPAAGTQGTVVNAPDGLRVRSGPGTEYSRIGTVSNGATVNILETADNGWYKISFTDTDGTVTEGYVLGDYISTN